MMSAESENGGLKLTAMANMAVPLVEASSAEHWIVLYYQYCTIINVQETCESQKQLCERLKLKGRVRVSEEGINGTLGGASSRIREYMSAVDAAAEFDAQRRPIHWKLSRLTDGVVHREFSSLSIKAVKEVVSLDLPEAIRAAVMKTEPGQHLQPREFHDILQRVSKQDDSVPPVLDSPVEPPVVMIDARNLYETRIGRFRVETANGTLQPMDPESRQFSDFARYVDDHVEVLNGRRVLMYCTGGVRCERASAYVRYALARVGGSAEVYQLSGGIHAYMEEYPEGGYFKGKNFVFDPRIAIPSRRRQQTTSGDNTADDAVVPATEPATGAGAGATRGEGVGIDEVIGRCLLCASVFDDYSRQDRCGCCRVLVLVCDSCDAQRRQQEQLRQLQQQPPPSPQQQQHSESASSVLICESCLRNPR